MARFWTHFGALLELFWHLLAPIGSLLGSLGGHLADLRVPLGHFGCPWVLFGVYLARFMQFWVTLGGIVDNILQLLQPRLGFCKIL